MSRLFLTARRALRRPCLSLGFAMCFWTSAHLSAETICTQLFDKLDEVEAQDGGEDAGAELEDARALYEQLSCPQFPTEAGCRDLVQRINRLQSAAGARGNLPRERQRLTQALRRAGCFRDSPDAGFANPGDGVDDVQSPELKKLLRENGTDGEAWDGAPAPAPSTGGGSLQMSPAVSGGRYTTLCVRSCDGFYFPISNTTSPSAFQADDAACKAACPNQQVSLYYVRPGEAKEQALDAFTNQSYTALANALHYRTKYEKTCQCAAPVIADPAAVDSIAVPKNAKVKVPQPTSEDEVEDVTEQPDVHEPELDVYRSSPEGMQLPGNNTGENNSIKSNGLRGASPAQR